MGLLDRWFNGARRASEASNAQLAAGASVQAPMSEGATRRELLRVVLRDTLHRQGIPAEWIAADMLTTTTSNGKRGVHWRLLVRHWDPRILTHGVAFQQALQRRVHTFDPTSPSWLHGISWQFALRDESVCPPLPRPGSWTGAPDAVEPAVAEPEVVADIMIGGPVPIAQHDAEAARADLEALLAVRDADFRRHGSEAPGWSSTEPAKL